jgi:DNA-binding HxlR family transcriptional regulator
MEAAMELEPDRCPVALTLSVIGGKWKPTILFFLKDRPRRFNELRRLLPQITQRMLTLQLRALEDDGVVVRTVHDTVPPQVEYALSGYGWTLAPIIDAMESWGQRHAGGPEPRAAHYRVALGASSGYTARSPWTPPESG